MADKIFKVFENCEVKKVGDRIYEFTASTSDVDRDGEVIDVNGWDLKNFKKNPVIMYAHNYGTLPIGKATRVGVRDGKLKNTVEFPPEGTYEFADIVERLVNTGYLNTESVGFIPSKWEFGDGEKDEPFRTYRKQELLEISIVPVPSNPNALQGAVDNGVISIKQFDVFNKEKKIEPLAQNAEPSKVSQEEIKDEVDYLTTLIKEHGISQILLSPLVNLITMCRVPMGFEVRFPGDDIPDGIEVNPSPKQAEESVTITDIQDAIKRIAGKNMEEK